MFAGIKDHLRSKCFLSRFREPTPAEDAVWSAIKSILESMGEIIDTLKEGAFSKITPKAVFALSPVISTSSGWIEVRVCDGGVALGTKL